MLFVISLFMYLLRYFFHYFVSYVSRYCVFSYLRRSFFLSCVRVLCLSSFVLSLLCSVCRCVVRLSVLSFFLHFVSSFFRLFSFVISCFRYSFLFFVRSFFRWLSLFRSLFRYSFRSFVLACFRSYVLYLCVYVYRSFIISLWCDFAMYVVSYLLRYAFLYLFSDAVIDLCRPLLYSAFHPFFLYCGLSCFVSVRPSCFPSYDRCLCLHFGMPSFRTFGRSFGGAFINSSLRAFVLS